MRLSDHFDSREFDCRDGTLCPAEYARSSRKLCLKYLEPLRAVYGPVHVVSGFRSAQHNTRIGGARRSMHLHLPGRHVAAADVICRTGLPADWHRLLERLDPGGLALYSSFVHVDNRPTRARW